MANVTLTINGVQVTVPAGTSLLDAATGAGCFIPTLCHDPANPGYGGLPHLRGRGKRCPGAGSFLRNGSN